MTNAAQRATLVLEKDAEESRWYVVAYLVRDTGQRERKTICCHDTRDAASNALEAFWQDLLAAKVSNAA